MALPSIQTSTLLSSNYLCSRKINASIHVPRANLSLPKITPGKLQVKGLATFTDSVNIKQQQQQLLHDTDLLLSNNNSTMQEQLYYAILEAVSDRVEMHKNVCEQRQNWNNLLLNNINMITLTAATLAGVAAATSTTAAAAPLLAMKLSSTLMFSAATGLLLIMNKIQPSQLAEEQRNATRLFKKLQTQIETRLALGNPTEEDVQSSMEKLLALDKAYPLPLLGAMLEKFPSKYEPANWWPKFQRKSSKKMNITNSRKNINGWSKELEEELRQVIEVVKRKDIEDYERLGNIVLKINKNLRIAGPLLTGIAAIGSAFVDSSSLGAIVAVVAGSLAAAVNAFEHGGQVGMVFEMYRNCGGFFKLLEETTNATLEESDLEKRENGQLFEMKMALQLGRSVTQLRELASKSAYCRIEGIDVDEFASKMF